MPEELSPQNIDDASPEDFSDEEFVTVFRSQTASATVEAESIHGLLESASIKSMIVRENVPELPTGWVRVKVLASDEAEALEMIESAQETAEASADEDESE